MHLTVNHWEKSIKTPITKNDHCEKETNHGSHIMEHTNSGNKSFALPYRWVETYIIRIKNYGKQLLFFNQNQAKSEDKI